MQPHAQPWMRLEVLGTQERVCPIRCLAARTLRSLLPRQAVTFDPGPERARRQANTPSQARNEAALPKAMSGTPGGAVCIGLEELVGNTTNLRRESGLLNEVERGLQEEIAVIHFSYGAKPPTMVNVPSIRSALLRPRAECRDD